MTLTAKDSEVVTEAGSANLALGRAAEKSLLHHIIIGVAIATPGCSIGSTANVVDIFYLELCAWLFVLCAR